MWTGPSGNFPAGGGKCFVPGVIYDSFVLRAIPDRNTSSTQAVGGQGRERTGESQNKFILKRRKKMLNKLKKNNKKGFTLVELIVVLVILAILAALLIPALTGYIDKARKKQIVAETRQVVMAAQTLVDEEYGKDATYAVTSITGESTTPKKSEIATLAEVADSNITSVTITDQMISEVVYTDGTYTCTYTRNTADLSKKGTYEVTP